jgi:hypothetical protein
MLNLSIKLSGGIDSLQLKPQDVHTDTQQKRMDSPDEMEGAHIGTGRCGGCEEDERRMRVAGILLMLV